MNIQMSNAIYCYLIVLLGSRYYRYICNKNYFPNYFPFWSLLIYIKKFLDSEWLRGVEFYRNTVSKNEIRSKRGQNILI